MTSPYNHLFSDNSESRKPSLKTSRYDTNGLENQAFDNELEDEAKRRDNKDSEGGNRRKSIVTFSDKTQVITISQT